VESDESPSAATSNLYHRPEQEIERAAFDQAPLEKGIHRMTMMIFSPSAPSTISSARAGRAMHRIEQVCGECFTLEGTRGHRRRRIDG